MEVSSKIRSILWEGVNADNVDKVANVLKENDVDPNDVIFCGCYTLLYCAKSKKMVKMLLDCGAEPDNLFRGNTPSPITRLFTSSLYTEESFEMLKMMVNAGAIVNSEIMYYAETMYASDEKRQKLKDDTIEFLKKHKCY